MTALLADTHGDEADYQAGCHCTRCRAGHAAYVAERRRSPRAYVPLASVQKHVAELRECGLSLREIARLADVDRETVRGLASGMYPRCTVETKRRVLGVLPPRQGKHIPETTDEGFDPEPTRDDPLAVLRLIIDDPRVLAWKADGDCRRLSIPVQRRQEWFFPERGQTTRHALTICATCPVWEPCLEFALANNCDGIWGRSAGNHRRRMVKHSITARELADIGMRDDPDLGAAAAIDLVLAAREQVA